MHPLQLSHRLPFPHGLVNQDLRRRLKNIAVGNHLTSRVHEFTNHPMQFVSDVVKGGLLSQSFFEKANRFGNDMKTVAALSRVQHAVKKLFLPVLRDGFSIEYKTPYDPKNNGFLEVGAGAGSFVFRLDSLSDSGDFYLVLRSFVDFLDTKGLAISARKFECYGNEYLDELVHDFNKGLIKQGSSLDDIANKLCDMVSESFDEGLDYFVTQLKYFYQIYILVDELDAESLYECIAERVASINKIKSLQNDLIDLSCSESIKAINMEAMGEYKPFVEQMIEICNDYKDFTFDFTGDTYSDILPFPYCFIVNDNPDTDFEYLDSQINYFLDMGENCGVALELTQNNLNHLKELFIFFDRTYKLLYDLEKTL